VKSIICIINPETGELTVKAKGYSGPACLQATKQLEEDLGMSGTRTLTADFYENENIITNKQNLGGES